MKIKNLLLTAIFIALGIVFPMATHSIASGPVLLPMHLIIFLAAVFLPFSYGLFAAFLIPILSSLITGMPALFPQLCIMVPELIVYAWIISVLSKKTNINVALVCAMLMGRIVAGVMVFLLTVIFKANLASPWVYVWSAIVTGLPGIAIQLIVVPILATALQKYVKKGRR